MGHLICGQGRRWFRFQSGDVWALLSFARSDSWVDFLAFAARSFCAERPPETWYLKWLRALSVRRILEPRFLSCGSCPMPLAFGSHIPETCYFCTALTTMLAQPLTQVCRGMGLGHLCLLPCSVPRVFPQSTGPYTLNKVGLKVFDPQPQNQEPGWFKGILRAQKVRKAPTPAQPLPLPPSRNPEP